MFDFKIFKTCRLNLVLESVIEKKSPLAQCLEISVGGSRCKCSISQTDHKLEVSLTWNIVLVAFLHSKCSGICLYSIPWILSSTCSKI